MTLYEFQQNYCSRKAVSCEGFTVISWEFNNDNEVGKECYSNFWDPTVNCWVPLLGVMMYIPLSPPPIRSLDSIRPKANMDFMGPNHKFIFTIDSLCKRVVGKAVKSFWERNGNNLHWRPGCRRPVWWDYVGFVRGFIASFHVFPRLAEVLLLQGFKEFSVFFHRQSSKLK